MSEVNAMPMSVPNAPNDLRCSIVNGTVILTWQPPTSNNGSAIIGYNLYRGTTSGMEQFLIAVENLTSFTDANVMSGRNLLLSNLCNKWSRNWNPVK